MLLSFITSFMASISRADSAESDAAAATATWKRKYEEQVEIVRTLGSTEQIRRYVHLSKTFHYYTI